MSIEYVTEKEQQLTRYFAETTMALKEMREERDALKNQLETANGGWYDKLLEATLERDALQQNYNELAAVADMMIQGAANMLDIARDADRLAAENKTLRDSYEPQIKLLQAEIDRLDVELAKAKMHIKHIGNDALRKENKTLRDALACISLASQDSGSTREGMGKTARAALQGANHEPN